MALALYRIEKLVNVLRDLDRWYRHVWILGRQGAIKVCWRVMNESYDEHITRCFSRF